MRPMTPRNPEMLGLNVPAVTWPLGSPCLTSEAITTIANRMTASALTAAPMLPAHLPYLRAMTATAIVTHTKTRPMMIDPVVPMSALLFGSRKKLLTAAMVTAESEPPIQTAFEIQYRIAVISPGSLP